MSVDGVNAPALPPLAMGGHVALGGGKKNTHGDTLENSGGTEGRGGDAQWEVRGALMKHGVRGFKMGVCLFVCMCAGGSSGGGGLLDESEGHGLGGTLARPITTRPRVMPPTHNPVTTTLAQGLARRPAPYAPPHPPPPPPPPQSTPPTTPPFLLRNEVIIEVDTVYAVHAGMQRRGQRKE